MDSINPPHIFPAFTIGLLATLNPCVLPLYPGYLAYLAGSGSGIVRQIGWMVFAGLMSMTLALGAMSAFLTGALVEWSAVSLQFLGIAITILMGVLLLVGINPFARVPVVTSKAGRGWAADGFLYGFLFAPMIMPCAGPLVISIFSLSVGIAGFVEQLLFFLIFGLGFGLPLLALTFLPREVSELLTRWFGRHAGGIGRISGLALIAFGAWNLRSGLEMLRLLW